ncbi:DUF1772 domain-containing protein [Polymorphospora sp. NPDC051019]|uniref:DUF1772 domain-containing protein n=1 Tax=Polymorphospora sp. NPDC051019 TaxID=3155725 RepID=UPI0034347B34
MSLLAIARTAAALLLGLFAGGLIFAVLAPSLRELPGPAYVRYWQALNGDYGRAMPVLLLTCVALLVATSTLSYRRGGLTFVLSLAATGLTIGVIVLTVTWLEPLNDIADSWHPDEPPGTWSDLRDRWWSLHLVRTVLALAAFACLLLAQAVDQPRAASDGAGVSAPRQPEDPPAATRRH